MSIEELTLGIKDCECKKEHLCPIDYVKIGHDAINSLSEICKEYKNILLISDENTWNVCAKDVYEILKDKVYKNLVLSNDTDVVIPNENKISEIEAFVNDSTDLIIGVGSGVINDLCKHVSFKSNLPYYIVATAPSMDGYASVGAALILNGMKITLNARPPKAIIADTRVLKDAPIDMLRAGYGDIIGKYSCLNDWKLSHFINDEYFCQRVYDLTFDCVKKVEELAEKIEKRDEETVGTLMEALVTVGIAMSYVGTSRPASGSEHHLSHFFEITGIINGEKYFAHGIDVIYSAIETAKMREQMLSKEPFKKEFNRENWECQIKRIYKEIAPEIISLQDKMGWYKKDDFDFISKNQKKIKEILAEVPSSEKLIEMAERVGLDYKEFEKMYGKDKIFDATLYAKDLKDRYTVLWLYYMYF